MKSIPSAKKISLAVCLGSVAFLSAQTGCQPPNEHAATEASTSSESGHSDASNQKLVSVKINTMTCVDGCFNGIRTVLKKRPGIQDVKLAPQSNDEGQVDNSVIFISYTGDLDKAEIERSVLGAGFESIEFLEENADAKATESAVN